MVILCLVVSLSSINCVDLLIESKEGVATSLLYKADALIVLLLPIVIDLKSVFSTLLLEWLQEALPQEQQRAERRRIINKFKRFIIPTPDE